MFKIQADYEDMPVAEARLQAFAQEHDIPDGTVSRLSLMLDEVLNNIISHGYVGDSGGEIEISFKVLGGAVEVAVADQGIPFNPLTLEPPDTGLSIEERGIGGLGVHLVRSLADDVTYQHEGQRNVLTLVKKFVV